MDPAQGAVLDTRAMFDSLSQGLEKAWVAVKKDALTADNIKGPIHPCALLEADVSLLRTVVSSSALKRRLWRSAMVPHESVGGLQVLPCLVGERIVNIAIVLHVNT
jgi:hypothetical protein